MAHEQSDLLTEAIVRTISQPLLVLDEDLNIERCNPAFLSCFQTKREETEGQALYEFGNGQWDIPELRRLLGEVLKEDEEVRDYRVEHDFEDIGRKVMLLNASRMQPNGKSFVLLAISDVTQQERERWELEGLKEYAEKIVDAVRDPLLVLDWDLRVKSANESFYKTFEVDPSETEGCLVYELGNGQWDIPKLRELLEDVLPEDNAFDDYVVEHDFEDTGHRVMILNARRLDHEQLILLAIEDITERQRAQERQSVLVGELQHRVKNILMNVRALARHSYLGSDDREGFMEVLDARLDALGRTQDLLVRSPGSTVRLDELIQLELEAANAVDKTNISNCNVKVPAHVAQALAMVFHELVTNAVKYGALSRDNGHIDITCKIETLSEEKTIRFRWREHGVHIENTRPNKGFGAEIIERSLPYMLGGKSSLVFHPDGAECTMEFPLPACGPKGEVA